MSTLNEMLQIERSVKGGTASLHAAHPLCILSLIRLNAAHIAVQPRPETLQAIATSAVTLIRADNARVGQNGALEDGLELAKWLVTERVGRRSFTAAGGVTALLDAVESLGLFPKSGGDLGEGGAERRLKRCAEVLKVALGGGEEERVGHRRLEAPQSKPFGQSALMLPSAQQQQQQPKRRPTRKFRYQVSPLGATRITLPVLVLLLRVGG
eukprot:120772-Rhodomonas_salina.1